MRNILPLVMITALCACNTINENHVKPKESKIFEPEAYALSTITQGKTDSLHIISSIQKDYDNILLNSIMVIDGKVVLTISETLAKEMDIPDEIYKRYTSLISKGE